MPDVWTSVQDLDEPAQERLAAVLETRGAEPQQQDMRDAFLASVPFAKRSNVLEVGCGTGVLCRKLATWPNVAAVLGIDPAPALIARATALAQEVANISFQVGDGRSLPFEEASFDAVVFDSTLCHIPGPERALAEAFRVLRPGGWLAAFDGDYATTTVALADHDPLQACVDAMMAASVTDRWLVRRLGPMAQGAGFIIHLVRGHTYSESTTAGYMLTIVDRGADLLADRSCIAPATASALKQEARHRVASGRFHGHITYGSVVARKPA